MMIRLSILLVAVVSLLESSAISIRGSNILYDPRNPSSNSLACVDDNRHLIPDARWIREHGTVDSSVVENGRLIFRQSAIGTDNPQRFEDRYRCEHNGQTSAPITFHVVPQRTNTSGPERHVRLEGQNVTIDCPLRFGDLRRDWNVEWTAVTSRDEPLPRSGYFTISEPSFQLVIRNATVNYEGARFQCSAVLGTSSPETSQVVTVRLFHEPEITSDPGDPVIVRNAHGIATFTIKAFPRPSVKFCYNNTCYDGSSGSGTYERIQIVTNPQTDTTYRADFTITRMTEDDNGNVTLHLNRSGENRTVMLFVPYKLDISKGGSVSNNEVPLIITLRRPLHFNYQIEFIDTEENVLGRMTGMTGLTSFQHRLRVERNTDVMARFRFDEDEEAGPSSDPISVDVGNSETTESSNNNVIWIVVAVLIAVVILAAIAAFTYIIKKRTDRKKGNDSDPVSLRDVERNVRRDNENEEPQPAPHTDGQNIAINPINLPTTHVTAPTPGSHPQNHPQGLVRPFYYGSGSSEANSIPSRKSSAGYESATGSLLHTYPCTHHQYAANYYSRCMYCQYDHHDHHFIPAPQLYSHQQPEQPEDEPDHMQFANSQQLTPATTNLSNPKPPQIRRNSSDPNISRHKQPPSRPLEQRTKKLLSSSSIV